MKTITEIRREAIAVIDNVITLKANVFNGCYSDQPELTIEEQKLEGIKAWAIANDQLQEICHYFAANFFGQTHQFAAADIAKFFNN